MEVRNSGREKPRDSRFELYAWLFMRFSGVLLIGLALGHLVIMHLINNVDIIDYDFVAARYATPFWRIYDLILLLLALLHGLNGMRTIVDDYVHPRLWRRVSLSLLYSFGFIFTVVGSYTILAFQPK
ncbi:succinate dehydrogenase, hydrophobic membrane anchor protein [candidate division TA06 bacterium]|nr:succinate dehydrogenase, hydrophobic membrane anchor protein [candidate division TA06 bacterium]